MKYPVRYWQIVLAVTLIVAPRFSYALDNRGCPASYTELQATAGHVELLKEVAGEKGYTAFADAGKVDPAAASALQKMQEAAKAAGTSPLSVASSYRSYNDQVGTFFAPSGVTNPIRQCYTNSSNRAEAKGQYLARSVASAPPGFSEHHSGKAFDFSPVDLSFENTTAFKWLQDNASKYGFRLSYPKGSTQGAGYEPWHWYYTGGATPPGPGTEPPTPSPQEILATNSGEGAQAGPAAGTANYLSYTNFPGMGRISTLCQLITALWYLGFLILFTAVIGMFSYGGYLYVTAGVNAGKVSQAKEIFSNTIIGLILGLSIYIILNIINPGLLTATCTVYAATNTAPGVTSPPEAPGNITPLPGSSVFPVTREYQCPGPRTRFGYARGRLHAGVDLTPPLSTIPDAQALQLSILAFRDGVVKADIGGGMGVVHIQHEGGLSTRYLHNSKIFVKPGDKVQAGQEIAKMGMKGSEPDIHLHFETLRNGIPFDPAPLIFNSGQQPDPSKVKIIGSPRCVGQNW